MSASKDEVVPMASEAATAHDALRATLQRVGVVFEFSVCRVAGEAPVATEMRGGQELMAPEDMEPWRLAVEDKTHKILTL